MGHSSSIVTYRRDKKLSRKNKHDPRRKNKVRFERSKFVYRSDEKEQKRPAKKKYCFDSLTEVSLLLSNGRELQQEQQEVVV